MKFSFFVSHEVTKLYYAKIVDLVLTCTANMILCIYMAHA